jgi:hypothetical protein
MSHVTARQEVEILLEAMNLSRLTDSGEQTDQKRDAA